MDDQQDTAPVEQDAQREMQQRQQQQQQREMEAQNWAAQTPGAPENITAPVAEAETEADVAAETENTIDPAIYDRITNPDLTAEERDKVARAMMETDQIAQDTFSMGAQMGAGMGLMELIQQFLGISDSFSDMQDMSGRVFEAFDKGLVTEEGKLNEGVVQPMLNDVQKYTPSEPAPESSVTQEPTAFTPS